MRRRSIPLAILLILVGSSGLGPALAQHDGVPDLAALSARLKQCWKPPALPRGNPGMEITVQFTFKRDGNLLGHPRITYETRDATDDERIIYRTAVMEALQRCVPMPFTPGMGGAIAGRPLTIRFDDRRTHPKPKEKRAWLTTTTL
ncbi:MAG: hypothetical protein BGN91_01650 [Nitrobacter sp. 62-13]|nr:MAG: hypothetical protein BGN91_01650 [Nitrobacter sp. 62-13]